MPYDIELMAIGEDIYPLLSRAAATLNGVQNQFKFNLSPPALRPAGIAFRRSEYNTSEIWSFLQDQKKKFGGQRRHIIAFVTSPLRSDTTRNLFGSHEAQEGLAVVTTSKSFQYVKEITRYCCYYLVRYALSFVNPHMKSHTDDARKDCYFHYKKYKPEIRASMDSGNICDECQRRLDNPLAEDHAACALSAEEREALQKMLDYVSGELPHALIMKGGGVKGLAFAGALIELEKFYEFDRHVGTSAGAIAAVLLAASYKPQELATLFLEKSFRDFMDAPWWRAPINLLFRRGFFPGETCRLWIANLLTNRIPKLSEVPMSALNGAIVYAARAGSGTLTFDSLGERRETAAAFAARCSMSIPFFFFPVMVDGRRVYDGGLRNNFPLTRFLGQNPQSNFIGVYLGKADNTNTRGLISLDLLNIAIDGEERQTVDLYHDKVIVIDTSPVGTTDFNLSDVEKQFLLNVGKAAALRFLEARKFDAGPTEAEVAAAESQAESGRRAAIQIRSGRRKRRLLLFLSVVAMALLIYLTIHLRGT